MNSVLTLILTVVLERRISLAQYNSSIIITNKPENIIGGVDAKINDFPFMVSLQIAGLHFCGATILTPNWLLTAAHCLNSLPIQLFDIHAFAGVTDCRHFDNTTTHVQERTIVHVHVHDKYGSSKLWNDIALLELSEPLELNDAVRPIELATSRANKNYDLTEYYDDCIVIGWGGRKKSKIITAPSTLQIAVIPLIPRDRCKKSLLKLGIKYQVPRTLICSIYPSNLRDVYHGDSGGPLICGYPGSFTQHGIISHGLEILNGPRLFTRIDKFGSWIQATMNKASSLFARILVSSNSFFLIAVSVLNPL